MSDLLSRAQLVLRDVGYETWEVNTQGQTVVAFENQALLGFVYSFDTAPSLLRDWKSTEQATLKQFAARFKTAGDKAWNVYSVFLTEAPALGIPLAEIEEDLSLTRKIARAGLKTNADIAKALLSILPIQSMPTLSGSDFLMRLSPHLDGIHEGVFEALLGDATPADVAGMLVSSS